MVEPETLSQVLARLDERGFTDTLKSDQHGRLQVFPRDIVVDPEDLDVEAVYRFEGESNLDDEEIVFAVSCAALDVKGTFVIAYGPKTDSRDADVVQRLHKRAQHCRGSR